MDFRLTCTVYRLMGQDEVYLQVIAESGEGSEKQNAAKVLKLLKRGKHWVLVTLLVGNVITNETLPIVLDRSIGGGYVAAISSTILVIIFGEIVPQSVCVRFGLPIGAWMANFVLGLMWVFCPITLPIAKLLDRLLGKDHGTTYKKAGLKTLVTLHKTMGESGAERLNEDEVSIISGVLDLKAKPVGSIMTPMNDVFVLSADAVLDEEMIDDIMREGYSRIPIHEPKNKNNFVGMLLVKMLITYDPEDARRVSDLSLATLPETLPSTSCLDIINFFQEGKSHMVLVSDYPGDPFGALGVVTLEDVIEELIGEEIIDESDVFVDVHKAIRRMQPAPTHRARLQTRLNSANEEQKDESAVDSRDGKDERTDAPVQRPSLSSDIGRSPRTTTLFVRRRSSAGSPASEPRPPVQARQYSAHQVRQQLRNLGPSNAARQPKSTRINTVKVKPAVGTIPEHSAIRKPEDEVGSPRSAITQTFTGKAASGGAGIGENLVSPGKEASDGVQAVQVGYGSFGRNTLLQRSKSTDDQALVAFSDGAQEKFSSNSGLDGKKKTEGDHVKQNEEASEQDTVGSLREVSPTISRRHNETVRSGSISENFVDSGGVKKLVLEMSSSSDDGAAEGKTSNGHNESNGGDEVGGEIKQQTSRDLSRSTSRVRPGQVIEGNADVFMPKGENGHPETGKGRKKKRKKKKKGANQNDDENGTIDDAQQDENTPLLNR